MRLTGFTLHLIAIFIINIFSISPGTTDNEFDLYVQGFEQLYGKKTNSVIVFKPSLDEYTIGTCNYTTKEIEIDKEYWYQISDYQREQLIYHELGHCELRRGHDDRMIDKDNMFIPRSIMQSYIVSEDIYIKNREYYLNELFSKGKP